MENLMITVDKYGQIVIVPKKKEILQLVKSKDGKYTYFVKV